MLLNVKAYIMDTVENLAFKVPFWNVDLPESPWDIDDDDSENLDILCDMVRNQYLKRLRQTLFDNLDVGPKSYQQQNSLKIQKCVDFCITQMEKQALRRCMVAKIYREGMTSMIKEVKTCTKNSLLYVLLENAIKSNDQLSLWANCNDVDNVTNQTASIGINNELKSYVVASTQTEAWINSDIDLFNNGSVNNDNTDLMDKSNLLSSSYNVKSEISDSSIFNNLSAMLNSSYCPSSFPADKPMELDYNYDSTVCSNLSLKPEPKNCTVKNEKNDLNSINSLLKVLQDSPEYEQNSLTLEDRLTALGLANEDHAPAQSFSELPAPVYINPNVVRAHKINEVLMNKLKSERVAKTYELQKSMNELSDEVKTRLNQRFDYLFGPDHMYESDPLSEEEERIIAHKRIVKMVVELMTPYYKAHRINRHLFKNLAKLISKNLMDRTYDPDEETVARGVSEFFSGNRCIKTIEDIYQ